MPHHLSFPDAARILVSPTAPFAARQGAWLELKARRGQAIHWDRLTPCHAQAAHAARASAAEQIDAALDRTTEKVRILMAARAARTAGGDAA